MSELIRRFPDGLPDELLALDPLALVRVLGRPTLVRVPGAGTGPPRVIATLVHGDEPTGFEAVLTVLRRRPALATDLYVVIGNVEAAAVEPGFAHRYLDDQEDMNRIWGLEAPTTAQRRAADLILAELRDAGPGSLVDLHNNSGDNPFYTIVTMEDPATVHLATLLTDTLVRWDLRVNTLMEAMRDVCPAVAVECGLAGQPASLDLAVTVVERYLDAAPLVAGQVLPDHDLLGGLVRITLRPEVRARFGGALDDGVDLVLDPDLDAHNFRELPAGQPLGRVHPGAAVPLAATDADGRDVTTEHLTVADGRVLTTRAAVPVMITRSVEAARKDCLLYLATEVPSPLG